MEEKNQLVLMEVFNTGSLLNPPSTLAEIFRQDCLQSYFQTSPRTFEKPIFSFGWNPSIL
jgi:hypothetical protein